MAIKRRSSPDRVELKKQKTRAAEPPAELSEGAKWMIQQIDHMQQAYKVYIGPLILVKLSLMQVSGSLDRCSVNNSASKSSQESVSPPAIPYVRASVYLTIHRGIKDIQTPVHLKSKLDNAWSRYEAVRRHVEWYTVGLCVSIRPITNNANSLKIDLKVRHLSLSLHRFPSQQILWQLQRFR